MTTIMHTLLAHLDARSLPQIDEVAQATGVPYHTIAKIKRRETTNPKIDTVQPLLDYFKMHKLRKKTA